MMLTGLELTSCATPIGRERPTHQPLIQPGDTVLFQGDSITDAGRNRKTAGIANDMLALGTGYAWLTAAGFLQNLGHSLPPILSMMKDIGGIEMPEFFGKILGDKDAKASDIDADGEGNAAPAAKDSKPTGPQPTGPRTPKGKPAE